MSRGRPIDSDTRMAVIRDLREHWGPEMSLRDIGAAHGISQTAVRTIATAAGITAGDLRAKTQNATADLKARNAQARERLAAKMIEVAESLVDDVAARRGTIVTGIADGDAVYRDIDALTPRDAQALMTAAGIAFDKHKLLEQYDSENDTTEVGKFLRALTGRE